MYIINIFLFALFLALSTPTWSGLPMARKTEPVELNTQDHEMIIQALEQLEQDLSSKVNIGAIKAKRYADTVGPAFFNQEYIDGPLDETYTRLNEVYCKQSENNNLSWTCKIVNHALVFLVGESEHTVWIKGVDLTEAVRIIEFLKTYPHFSEEYCTDPPTFKPCEQKLNDERLRKIKLIRYSYSDKNIYIAGDNKRHPFFIYEIAPEQCDIQPCQLQIIDTGQIVY